MITDLILDVRRITLESTANIETIVTLENRFARMEEPVS